MIPSPPGSLLHRPRLLDLVAPPGDTGARVTLLCAPAGSGKTTLLAEWARTRPGLPGAAVAWLSLGVEDNDAHVLWSGVLRALEDSGAWAGTSPLAELRSPHGRPDPAFTSAFLGAFTSVSRTPVVLVLDDAHLLTDPVALEGLDVVLRSPPPGLRVVLSARFEPPLSLPRLRLEGMVAEIGGDRLGFTAGEADELLRLDDIRLSPADLARLLAHTEGWAAGLRLAALWLAGAENPGHLLARFAGDQRAVADYLVQEVLDRQDPDLRRFLLDTCVCEQLTPDLARALSGRDDAGALLDRLERSNSFVTRLGRDWYRVHPMLREYLSTELARQRHEDAVRQHRVAARWFEGRGDSLPAVEHAAAAGDDELLSTLLGDHGLRLVTSGAGSRVRRAVRHAGVAMGAHPILALIGAAAAVDGRDPATADRLLAHATPAMGISLPAEVTSPTLDVLAGTVALQRARFESEPAAVLELLAEPPAEPAPPDLQLMAHLERGLAWYWLGRLEAAEDDLQRAMAVARAEGRHWMTMQCLAALADVALARCDLPVAGMRAAATLTFAGERGWTEAPAAVSARVVQGWLALHAMDDAEAARFAAAPPGSPWDADPTRALSVRLLQTFARFGLEPGGFETALVELRELWGEPWPRHLQPQLVALAHLMEQRAALEAGSTAWAVEAADRAVTLLGETGDVEVLRAVTDVRRGRTRAARHRLLPVLEEEVLVLTPLSTLSAWLWEARLALRAGEHGRAATAVTRAVAIAAPRRLLRPLAHGGAEITDLLSRAAGSFGHDDAFVELARSAARPAEGLADVSLTTRELDLLTELPSMRTAEEIAETMLLSVNTVKTHIRGIYRKLGVTNRRDAVATARRRGLL